jgi:hypothetical protein
LEDGGCLWDLSLGRRTGDGKFGGETFLGRLWMFFFGLDGGGRGGDRARSVGLVLSGRRVLSNIPIFLCNVLKHTHVFFVFCPRVILLLQTRAKVSPEEFDCIEETIEIILSDLEEIQVRLELFPDVVK